ncbi:hypothetical protein KPH14_009397 [Odynerus spinipes]|uniref:Uncharacterized protein n=1 Tax=Odynerus spinipes TaxID=1348599 RepID=A0AAD9RP77_9HYME|nr:hypothetical protein KPH14_009397 [Odynerus spinipes]
MRFASGSFILALALASVVAGPVAKVTEKKSLIGNTKLEKEAPKIEEIGDEKDRAKKSTTTFCVEIRPGTNEAVQTPCACKDKQEPVPQSAPQQIPQLAPQLAPQPAPQVAPQAAPQPTAASAPPSVNIIHAPPQQPQTLNIIQPAPTLHAVHFVQPQSAPSAIQNLHIFQPAAHLPEPVPQYHQYEPSSKPSEESHPSEPVHAEAIVKPSEPAPQPAPLPAPQPEHAEHGHKSQVHVSVVTEDKNKEEESKPHFENIVQPVQRPVETIKIVPVAPLRQPCEEQVVVMPPSPMMMMHQPGCQHSGALIQVPQMSHGPIYQPQSAFYQPQGSVYQLPSPIYQQGGPVYTECSCKQTHSASSSLPSHLKATGRNAKIMPLIIYPPAAPVMPVQSEKSAVSVHCSPETSGTVASHSSDSPMIINMQTARSKDGAEQGEAADMMTPSLMDERTVSHISLDTPSSYYHGHVHHTPKVYYDVVPGMQASLYKEPLVKPYYGNHQVHMDISRQAQPTLEDPKKEETKEMKVDSNSASAARITRSDKDATSKVEEKTVEEKKVEEKTSSVKAA